MKTRLVLVLGALALLSGCSAGASSDYPAASPSTELEQRAWERQRCERWGGYWNRTANICESQHAAVGRSARRSLRSMMRNGREAG